MPRAFRRLYLLAALPPLLAAGCGGADEPEALDAPPEVAAVGSDSVSLVVTEGLLGPESALHDEVADVYLVSNVNGPPLGRDGNGFISRLGPDGTVREAQWIAGGQGGVTLNAPKGLALRGDTLLVADIDVVRLFHRTTGEPLGEWPVQGATFLNDVAVGPDGAVYVTDTGMRASGDGGMEISGTAALHRFDDAGMPTRVAGDTNIGSPNGVSAAAEAVYVVTFDDDQLLEVTSAGAELVAALPAPGLDGVVALPDGSLLVSSWEGTAVYRVEPGSEEATTVMQGVQAPADIGWDARRGRLLVPQLTENQLQIQSLPDLQ